MDKNSYLSNAEPLVIEELYNQYLRDPDSLEPGWRNFFEGFEFARNNYSENPSEAIPENVKKEFAVLNLINLYRATGHLFTKTNPVRERRKYAPSLDEIELIGLSQTDMETVFHAGTEIGIGPATLKNIIAFLKETYCQSIGAEFMYIRNQKIKNWLKDKMETARNTPKLSSPEKKNLLHKISNAVVFENFLHTRFTGQKRFSLEGAESVIPALDAVIEYGAELGIQEFVMGMSHRGRLNVLANILKKTYEDIFNEFEGKEYEDALFEGDVKYHNGYSSNIITSAGKKIHLSLTPNPSHLEAVDPVVEGIVRAKIDRTYEGDPGKIAPILIHGDAAIAAQGVVYEVIQMSNLDAYKTGGTIHLVINNQVGFTTNYIDGRSSTYCTDIAKVILSPVFHVNGDDVEALVHTIKLAMEFRQVFHRDVFIDILCYRKYGHNEGDEPRFTQPLLYELIAAHPDPRKIYLSKLLTEGAVTQEEADQFESDFRKMLDDRLNQSKQIRKTKVTSFLEGAWKGLRLAEDKDFIKSPSTAVDLELLKSIGENISTLPKDKKFFSKIEKLFAERRSFLEEKGMVDWAMGELLAYGTLVNEKIPVRFSGQDVERGTFSHRHAVVRVDGSEEEYIPLNFVSPGQGTFEIYNSHLSEYAVLGFEYGYSMASPNSLTIWEAQFGDFANGAQIIIDQYISASEDKWRRMNGLTMLLPHGYEGQGAEHSSARLERFLTLCAGNNMFVVNCTTPANFFHVLRRQIHLDFRKPLIVFTPKSLLRHPKCVSPLNDLAIGGFKELLDDSEVKPAAISKMIFCSGKIYYDLIAEREKRKESNIAVIRLEQLYPLPVAQIQEIILKYRSAKDYLWVQEEPENMGAWSYILRMMKGVPLKCISRPASSTPATGSKKLSDKQSEDIMNSVFNN